MTEPEGLTARFDVDREGLSTRLAGLARSATRMHESLSVQAVMDRVVEEAVELIGAHQGVVSFTVDRNWTQAISSAYLSDRYAAYRGYDEQPRGEGIYRLVCERNESMRMTQAELEAHPAWRGFGDAADRHPPMRGWLAAPLVARDGRNLGVVQLTDKAVGEFTSEDEAVLNQLAAIAAIAIENASVYERERHAAQQLQSELLPADLPRVRGLSIATRYRAGEQGARVGGDWYDVIALDDDRVAMVVGDVMGRGVSAASVMGQLRIGVRAYALQGLGPSSVLRNVDDLLQSLGGEYFATVLYAVWDLERDSVTFASAGHLPPLLRLPDRTTSFLRGKQGPPLGVDCPEFFDHQVHIPHGSALMLYTDGLVEQRDTPLGRTLGVLAQAAAAAADHPEGLARDVLDASATDGTDDVALVVARREPKVDDGGDAAAAGSSLGSLTVSPRPEEAGRAREWIAGVLARNGFHALTDDAELLISEAATNALVHASTQVTVNADRRPDRVRVAVSDADIHLPAVAALDGEATSGRGLHVIDRLADDWGVYIRPGGKTVWFDLTI